MDKDPDILPITPPRLIIPAPDLEAEADALAEKMLAELAPQMEANKVNDHKPIEVTVGVKSGKVRRNSVCPCGSGVKYKKCCMALVDAGELPRLSMKGRKQQPLTKAVRPKKYHHNRYAGEPEGERHHCLATYLGDRVSKEGILLKGERADVIIVNSRWGLAQFNSLEKFGEHTQERLAYGRHKFRLEDFNPDPDPFDEPPTTEEDSLDQAA